MAERKTGGPAAARDLKRAVCALW